MRALRTLAPVRLSDARQTSNNQRMRRAAFAIALFAVILEFAISGNTLESMGINYATPGGNPLMKLHPGTYLVMIAAFMVLMLARPTGSGLVRFFRDTPALAAFVLLTLFCSFYSIANVGFSGAAVYVESYLSAGFLAVALAGGTDRQKRSLAWWILGFCVLSIAISIVEGATQTHLITLHFGDATAEQLGMDSMDSEDFRGAGLFPHPLTGALTTSMAIFLLLRMRMNWLLKAVLFTTFLIGLLSFGGRAALGITLILLALAAAVVLLRGIVTRNLSIGFVGTIAAAVVILPPLMLIVITSTDIGERIFSHLYLDESADARTLQWLVLNHLNLHDALFGVAPDRLANLKYQIGLGGDTTDIENFWLLMFLNLGAIGFVVFLIALGLFLMHLGRTTAHPLGWMLLIASVLIDSTSNSMGRKSVDLFFMVACLVAMTGYQSVVPAVTMSIRRKALTGLRRTTERLNVRPTPANLAGFKP
jgi:hypothetical protein